jgi:cell division protein FtsZ
MVFITVNGWWYRGTGAAPVIAQVARDMDILPSVQTTPFQLEGKVRNEQAQKGIEKFARMWIQFVIINTNCAMSMEI